MRRFLKPFAALSVFAALAACDTNRVSVVEQPDGTFELVDSEPATGPVQEAREFYRAEGRVIAQICSAHAGNNQVVGQMLVAAGYSDGPDIFHRVWFKRREGTIFRSLSMSQQDPCRVTMPGDLGRQLFRGAEAALLELGFEPVGDSQWSNGSTTVKMTGQVRSSSQSGTSSTVEIEKV